MEDDKKLILEESAKNLLKEKEYTIAGKVFINKITVEQYEAFDEILSEAGVTAEDLAVDFNGTNVQIATGLIKIYNKLKKKKLLRKLFSYYLVAKSDEFTVEQAVRNEELFKKIDNRDGMVIFRDFFIGNYLSLSSLSEDSPK